MQKNTIDRQSLCIKITNAVFMASSFTAINSYNQNLIKNIICIVIAIITAILLICFTCKLQDSDIKFLAKNMLISSVIGVVLVLILSIFDINS